MIFIVKGAFRMKKEEIKKIYKPYTNDFIATNFVGWDYDLATEFIEVILERLRQQSKDATDKTILNILGRELTL